MNNLKPLPAEFNLLKMEWASGRQRWRYIIYERWDLEGYRRRGRYREGDRDIVRDGVRNRERDKNRDRDRYGYI